MNTIIFDFSLIGDHWDLDSFSEEIVITPTESYKKGDEYTLLNQRIRHRIETSWRLGITRETAYDHHVDDLYNPVIEALNEHVETIKKYKDLYDLTCLLSLRCDYHNVQTPGVRLDASIINFASKVDAIIDIYIDNEEIF